MRLLDDNLTEDIILNPDGSLWVKRMGHGFARIGEMPAAQAASALGTIAAWRGTVLNHEHPILETELPIDGSRFEGIVSPVVRVLSASLRSGTGSEAVALCHPVMPIANGLGCGFVGIDGSQLR